MSWYTAHAILYVKLKEQAQERFPLWENLILIEAESEAEAFAKAERRGRDDEGDDDGSFRWAGKPAEWVFAGIRKLTPCEDPDTRPGDGTEVSFMEMEVASREALDRMLDGEPVSVTLADRSKTPQPDGRL